MPQQASPSQKHSPLRVLIVDDVAEVRLELSVLLELTDEIRVVGEASNGVQAVRECEILRPDVVIMDLEMPVMDGFEAARRIRAAFSECRIIALTIHAGAAERQQALQAGMAGVVVKGAPLAALLQAIGAGTTQKEVPARD